MKNWLFSLVVFLFSNTLFAQLTQLNNVRTDVNYRSVTCYNNAAVYATFNDRLLRSFNYGNTWDTIVLSQNTPMPLLASALYKVYGFNDNTLFGVGVFSMSNTEMIVKSTDNGLHWQIVYSNSSGMAPRVTNAIDFGNTALGIVVGNNGRILRTTNGGDSWNAVNSGVQSDIYDVAFSNSSTVFACTDGKILKSINGGQNWTVCLSSYSTIFEELYFVNANVGYASTQEGSMYKTIDGGLTWSSRKYVYEEDFSGGHALQFLTENVGYSIHGNVLYQTTDGGQNWDKMVFPHNLRDLWVNDDNSFFVAGENGQFYRSMNGPGNFAPIAAFSTNPTTYCNDSTITLTNNGNPSYSFDWKLNNVHFSSAFSPTLTFNNPGTTNTITLDATHNGITTSKTISVYVQNSLNFPISTSVQNSSLCQGQTDNLVVNSSQQGVSYLLQLNNVNIGSSQTGNGSNLNFATGSVLSTGNYCIKGTKTIQGCGSNTQTSCQTITVNTPSTAVSVISANPSTICYGQNTSISISNSETNVSYQLMNGTTAISSAQNGTGGTLSIGLTNITNTTSVTVKATRNGCVNYFSPVIVTVDKPELLFSLSNHNPVVGNAISTMNNTSNPGGSISWDFGSGATPSTAISQNVSSISYNSTGEKTISLSITTVNGCQYSLSKTIEVISSGTSASCQALQVATANNSSSDFEISTMERDANDNLLMIYKNTYSPSNVLFSNRNDSLKLKHFTYNTSGNIAHVVKCNPNGIPLWAFELQSGNTLSRLTTSSDADGNILVATHIAGFNDSIRCYTPDGRKHVFSLTTSGNSNLESLLIAKYDANGNFIWGKVFDEMYTGDRVNVEADAQGNVFVSGESFTKKLNSNGVVQWSVENETADIEPDQEGGVYVLLKSQSTIQHFNATGVIDKQTNPLNSQGTVSGISYGAYLKRDELGNIYIVGRVSEGQIFGIDTISSSYPYGQYYDHLLYMAKLNQQLNAVWAKKIETNAAFYLSGFDVKQNNIILGVRTTGTLVKIDTQTNTYTAGGNYFLIRTDSLGNNTLISSYYHSTDASVVPSSLPLDALNLYGNDKLDFGFAFAENTTVASGTTFQAKPNFKNYGVNLMNVSCVFNPSPSNLPVAYFNQTFVGCTNTPYTFTNNSLNNPTSFSWVFEGGTPATSTLANPSIEFASTGTHLVHLTVTNSYGSNQYTSYITVGDQPNAVITGSTVICYGSDTDFWVTGADSYLWSDGTTLDNMYVRNVQNDFTASVIATSSGCSMLVEYPVTVDVTPNIAILGSIVDTVCSNSDPFELPAATPEGGYYTSYGSISGNTFNPAVGDPDAFTMIHYIYQSPAGCVYETLDSVFTINNTVYGSLLTQASSYCVGDSATFTIDSNPQTTQWLWLLDGQFSTSDNLENQTIHVRLEEAGFVNVRYKLSMMNCPLIEMGSGIAFYSLPDASISASQYTACNTDAPISLSYSSSDYDVIYDYLGEITGDIYDLSRASGNQAIIYHQANTNEGCTVTDSIVIAITDLNASFSFEGNGCPGLPVQFTSTSGAEATSFNWNFNGGVTTQSTLANPVAQFNTYGNYTVILTTSRPGCPDDHDTMTVAINGLTVNLASFSVDTICHSANAIPIPTGTPAGGVYSEAGNGISGNQFNPQIGPTGWRTLYYEISNNSGCIGRDSSKIFVLNPLVSISPNTTVCQNQNFTFHGTSTGHPTSWSWGTQNGAISNSTTANPSINYSVAGTFPLNVTVGDYFCPPVSASINVTVAPSQQSDLYQSACTQYHWTATNQTYTQSGNYQHVFSSVNGCDSVVILHLTIHTNTQSDLYQTACGQYTWTQNGQTYSQTGVYPFVTSNSNGCDSTINLHLTIVPISTTPQYQTNCSTYLWPLTGLSYTQTGIYADTLTSSMGCDSIIQLHLTITPPTAIVINGFNSTEVNSCDGTYTVNLYGNPSFTLSIDGGTSVSNITQYHTFTNLCSGVHQLQVADNCSQSVNTTIVVPNQSTSIFNDPFGNQAIDSSGTTLENCEIDFATIDTAFIYSVSTLNNVATVIWNIIDANGTHLDTVTYNLQNGDGVYFLQLSLYCPNKDIGDYFTVTETVNYTSGTVHTAGVSNLGNIDLFIYPNPTNDNLQLQTSLDVQQISIYNQLGEKVGEYDYQKGKTISVKHLSPGFYYLKVQSASNYTLPFIKSN